MKKPICLLRRTMFIGMAVVGLIVGSQTFAQAERGEQHSCPMMQRMMGASVPLSQHTLEAALHHAGQLGLSEEQLSSLKAIRLSAVKEQAHHETEMKIIELELADLFDHLEVDLKAVEAKLKEGEAHRTAAQISHLKFQEQARKVLTTEQWQELKTIHAGSAMPPMPEKQQHQHGEGGEGHSGMTPGMCGH
ncbi:MAG: hypothetical protein HY709_05580 [Candidatus Latescibacteria bacterium]|nr:hypothetical protein [Candidatus Latescibacterota bacterium]